MAPLRAPFPWFGGKSLAAPFIWRAFGNVPNYVEPFAGSLATLLARPSTPKVETVNDKDGLIANFWRAVQHAPADVAKWADWPVNEADLHARHQWLVNRALPLTEKLIADPDWFDAKVAGWWVWGICSWIGNGWCSRDERLELHRCMPKVGSPGHGIHAIHRKMPRNARGSTGIVSVGKKPLTHRNKGVHASGSGDLMQLFAALADRLRHVRVCCGDWTRVMGRSTLGIDTAHGMTPCGVLLDPPYAHDKREKRLYREDHADLSGAVRAWAIENGPNPSLRIALCGWEGEHDMPDGWTCIAVKTHGSGKNRDRERIWFSPQCRQALTQGNLFEPTVIERAYLEANL
jgi:DNA adenine methylase